jgi:hypothetical protein
MGVRKYHTTDVKTVDKDITLQLVDHVPTGKTSALLKVKIKNMSTVH